MRIVTLVVLFVLAGAADADAATAFRACQRSEPIRTTLRANCEASWRGAFIAPAGQGEVVLRSTTLSAAVAYDDDTGVVRDPGLLRVQTTSLLAFVGLAPRLMGSVQVPFVAASAFAGDVAQGAVGLGDAVLALQFGLFDDEVVALSARSDVKVPLYQGRASVIGRQPVEGTRIASAVPALGDGQIDVTLSGLFTARFPFGGFVSWETGYRLRTGDVSDAVVGGGTFLVPVLDGRLSPMWNLQFINSLDPAVDADDVAVEAVGRGFVATGPAVEIALRELHPGLSLHVGVELVFRGRNAPGGVQLLQGVRCAF